MGGEGGGGLKGGEDEVVSGWVEGDGSRRMRRKEVEE